MEKNKVKPSLEYFKGDSLASDVWEGKYAHKDSEEVLLEKTPEDMHRRMAKEFSRIERSYKEPSVKNGERSKLSNYGKTRKQLDENSIYELFKDFKYIIPQGSIMSTLGTPIIGSLSNCWVAESPLDSYGGILKTDGDLAYYYKRRGGVGTDLSNLRPKNSVANNIAKSTTGAVSFMHRYSNTTREVSMGNRRGALMLSMDVNHPDILDFIKIKRDGTSVTGANISIRLNNEFMKAVQSDGDYVLRYPCGTKIDRVSKSCEYGKLYTQVCPTNKNTFYYKRIKAKKYWDEIVHSAKNYAEPGLLYWDNALDYDPATVYEQFKPTSTNPCGEQLLNPNDSCRLMAINLFSFVENPFKKDSKINEDKLYEVCYEHARLGDGLVDLELEYIQRIIDKIISDPEPDDIKRGELELWEKSYKNTKSGRRIGLGITALGDMLAALGFGYDSEEGLKAIELAMRTKMKAELDCSIDLAVLRGSFEGWDVDKEFPSEHIYGNKFYSTMAKEFPEQAERMYKYGRRNVSSSTIAPTGSVSILTQTTSGCEPLFQPFYMRRKKINSSEEGVRVDFVDETGDSWQEFPVLHEKFKEWCVLQEDVLYNIDDDNPNIKVEELKQEHLEYLFEMSPWHGSTANEIDWIKRNEVQAILQKYTSNAISSTINLPSTVTEQEVSDIYMNGWKLGLKGQTVYVDGSRSGVLVDSSKKKEELVTFHENHAPKRPKKLMAKVVRFNNNYEKWVAFVGLLDNKPYEVFTGKLENVGIPNDVTVGSIVKVKSGSDKRYDFIYEGGDVQGISMVASSNLWNYGKLISGMLRHGMPLQFVVNSIQDLNWEEDHINTWKNGIARALKKFIADGEAEGVKCNDCSSENVIFQEGCLTCKDCGSSKCG